MVRECKCRAGTSGSPHSSVTEKMGLWKGLMAGNVTGMISGDDCVLSSIDDKAVNI